MSDESTQKPRPTGTEIQHARRVASLASDQLPRLRRVAEQWRNGTALATIVGGAVAALTAPEVVAAATDAQKTQGSTALAVALLLSIVAIGLSMRASFGWPKVVDLKTPTALAEWERKEIDASICALRVSIWLALLSVIAFGAAGAVLVFGYTLDVR